MAGDRLTEIPVIFYRTAAGGQPVRDWLRSLPAEDRRTIGTDLATVQVGWPIGMPLCRSLGAGLWEVRSMPTSNRIARLVFFCREGADRCRARFRQENAEDPAGRYCAGGETDEGDDAMS